MSDAPQPNRKLSEISHLFLSDVRQRHTNGASSPQRRPPAGDLSIDLTPEEFAEVFGGGHAAEAAAPRPLRAAAIIGAHLNGSQFERAGQYARHLVAGGERVGLVYAGETEFRLICFDRHDGPDGEHPEAPGPFDARAAAEALQELHHDVDRWLLVVPNPREPNARALLRAIDHWVLLCTCDHDGVVSCYRTLKGLAEAERPRLSLALLDADDPEQAARVSQKLLSVCRQFLNWLLETEPPIRSAAGVAEHPAFWCRLAEKPLPNAAPAAHWKVLKEFFAGCGQMSESAPPMPGNAPPAAPAVAPAPTTAAERQHLADIEIAQSDLPEAELTEDSTAPQPVAAPVNSSAPPPHLEAGHGNDVIDLCDPQAGVGSILAAVLRHAEGALVECPIRPPMCPDARLAVDRGHRLVLLAVAREGLTELRCIGQAFGWLMQNRRLIGMAMPQFAVDAQRPPGLRLLVDQADLSADLLRPMLESEHVTVQAYRRLRWGERAGLLLEAA